MAIVRPLATVFATFTLCVAATACTEISFSELRVGEDDRVFSYTTPTTISGNLDRMRGFDTVGVANVLDEDGMFEVIAEAPIPQGQVMTIVYAMSGDRNTLTALEPGTKLHLRGMPLSEFDENPEALTIGVLDEMGLDATDVTETEDVGVSLCGGDPEGDWLDVPASEAVIEIEATEDPNVMDVTVTAVTTNPTTGELDVMTTSFSVNVQ